MHWNLLIYFGSDPFIYNSCCWKSKHNLICSVLFVSLVDESHSGNIETLHPRFRTSNLTALVSYTYCGEEYFLVLCFLLSQEVHTLAGLLYPTSLLFHTTILECPWCTINIPPRELRVSEKLPVTAIKIRTDLNQNRNPFLSMRGQSISANTAKSGGTWYNPAMTCSAAKASSSQKSTFKQELSHGLS